MKLYGELFGLCVFLGIHFSAFSQPDPIQVREYYDGKTLELIFLDLSLNYQVKFNFDREDVRGIEVHRLSIKGLDLETTMKALLKDTGLDFSIEGPREVSVFLVKAGQGPAKSAAPVHRDLKVSGWIYDGNTRETLPYATASVEGVPSGAITNPDGHFTLLNVPTDTSTLLFNFLGYETMKLKLQPGVADQELEIGLKPVDYRIEEVMIVGEEKKMVTYAEKTSQISLRPAQIDVLPNLGERDIFRTLKLMPGVSSGNETSSGLYVRGGTPDQNLVLLDGITVYHVDHFYGFLSAFNADAIKDVQLYKGGFEAKYGGKISSVMELTGKTGNTRKPSGGISLSALSGSAHLELPLSDRFNLFFSGRRSYTDLIQSGLYNKINEMYNQSSQNEDPMGGRFARFSTQPSFHFYDLNAKLTYKPTPGETVTLSFYNGKDVLDKTADARAMLGPRPPGMGENNFTVNSVDKLEWGNRGSSAKWSRQWTDKFYSNTTLAFSNYFSHKDRSRERTVTDDSGTTTTSSTGSKEDNNIFDYTFRSDLEYRFTQHNTLEFGLQSTFLDISCENLQNDTLELVSERTRGLTLAAYLQDKIFIKDRLTLLYGFRTTYYNLTGKLYLEPRASVNYKLDRLWNLKFSWGRYYQFTNRVVRENVLEGNRDFWLLADDEMVPVSSAYHYIGGVSYENTSFLFDVEMFYKPMKGLAEFTLRNSPDPMDVASSVPNYFYHGKGKSLGFELLAQKKFGSYTGWISYTFSRVIHEFEDLNDGRPFPAVYDQPHEINVVNTYQRGNWVIGAAFVYNTGRTYTAPVGTYTLTMLDGSELQYIHVGEKNGYRLPAYHRLDLSVTYRFSIGRTLSSLGVSLFNIYGRENVWYREFEVEDNEIIIMDVNTLGFTPNLFFSIKF
jgi:ferric enterobactin receptor